MGRPRRRVVAVLAGVVAPVLLAGVTFVLLQRGEGPEDVAEDYLAASWQGAWRTECELATEEWRRYLFEGFPFADCQAYAVSAENANGTGGFADFADDTDLAVSVETLREGDGTARVAYLIEFDYRGEDRAGFDELWQGGGAVDRGTVELVEVDGEWRVAGVDAG